MGLVAVRQHPWLDEPSDIEKEVAELVEPDQRAHPLFLVVGDDDDLALIGAAQRILLDILKTEGEGEPGAGHHRTVPVYDRGLGQPAHRRLRRQYRRQILRIELKDR